METNNLDLKEMQKIFQEKSQEITCPSCGKKGNYTEVRQFNLMFQTKITEMFGIRYPLVVGTMMHLARAEMVAAASQAGALGVLASAMFTTKEEFRREVRKVKELTDKPFAVNLNLFPMVRPVDNREYVEVIFDEGVKIVETSGHKAPDELGRDHTNLGGRTPDEVRFHHRPVHRIPRFEPRARWPRSARCALPQVLVKGQPGVRIELEVSYQQKRKHLPVATLRRVA